MTNALPHTLQKDFAQVLFGDDKANKVWETLTPLAQNEWICWIISPKQEKTRQEHVKRTIEELKKGKRRPCCWMGCAHRKDKPLSPSQKFILRKRQ